MANNFIASPGASNALYKDSGGNTMSAMMPIGQGRATNTIDLRNKYNEYAMDMQSSGEQPMSFEEWAAANFPDQAILNQGG